MTNLNKVFTIHEASARFNIPASTLKSYCAGQAVMQKGGKSYHYPPKFLSTGLPLGRENMAHNARSIGAHVRRSYEKRKWENEKIQLRVQAGRILKRCYRGG